MWEPDVDDETKQHEEDEEEDDGENEDTRRSNESRKIAISLIKSRLAEGGETSRRSPCSLQEKHVRAKYDQLVRGIMHC